MLSPFQLCQRRKPGTSKCGQKLLHPIHRPQVVVLDGEICFNLLPQHWVITWSWELSFTPVITISSPTTTILTHTAEVIVFVFPPESSIFLTTDFYALTCRSTILGSNTTQHLPGSSKCREANDTFFITEIQDKLTLYTYFCDHLHIKRAGQLRWPSAKRKTVETSSKDKLLLFKTLRWKNVQSAELGHLYNIVVLVMFITLSGQLLDATIWLKAKCFHNSYYSVAISNLITTDYNYLPTSI